MQLNGPSLRAIRLRTPGMSVSKASRLVGVTQPTWSNWELEKRHATVENLLSICAVLGIEDPCAIAPRALNPEIDTVLARAREAAA